MILQAMPKPRTTPIILCLLGIFIVGIIVVQYRSFRVSLTDHSKSSSISRSLETTDKIKHIVPLDQLISGGIAENGIPSIDEPKFESVAVADQYLNNDGLGIAIEQKGAVKFYPYQILVWHHAVNDIASGIPILVSFSPLAYSGAVFERTVSGSIQDFGVSDRVYNNDLLLSDRKTKSLWDPMLHEASVGDLAGTSLSFYPFSIMTWNDFKQAHPNGNVLSRKSGAERDYTHDPYENYYSDDRILFPVSSKDDRLPSKEMIVGVETTEGWKAYPIKQIEKMLTIQDRIGTLSISIETEKNSSVIRVSLVDTNGTQIKELPFIESYWFAWSAAYPQTEVYK